MEDLSIDITYDPCLFSLDSTFKKQDHFLGAWSPTSDQLMAQCH